MSLFVYNWTDCPYIIYMMTNTKKKSSRRFQIRTFNGFWVASMNDETKARAMFDMFAATTAGAQLVENGIVIMGPTRLM